VAKLLAQRVTDGSDPTTVFNPDVYFPNVVAAYTGTGAGWDEAEIGSKDDWCFAEIELVSGITNRKSAADTSPTGSQPTPASIAKLLPISPLNYSQCTD